MKKRVLLLLVTLAVLFSLLSVTATAADTDVAKIGNVAYNTLSAAITEANTFESGATIELLADVTLGEKLTISGDVTIKGKYTITRDDAYTGTLFTVNAGATLTLDSGLTIDGGNNYTFDQGAYDADLMSYTQIASADAAKYFTPEEGAPVATAYMIVTNGTVNLNDVTIQNHYSTNGSGIVEAKQDAHVTLDGAQIKHNASTSGSGLVVNAYGKNTWSTAPAVWVTMEDGTVIDGNHVGGNHGVFKVYSGTVFTMNGGSIKNTTGWNSNGVAVGIYWATFNMNDGEICSNSSVYGPSNGRLAAVYVHNSSTFNMAGGTICHNTGAYGGIDSPKSNSVTTITGGSIVNNNSVVGSNYTDIYGGTTTVITGGEFTQDVSQWCENGYNAVYNEEGGVWVVNSDYVMEIKNALLEGESVTLDRDIVVDGSYIDSIPAATNSNGVYFNPGIFNVVGNHDVTFDLNGHTITYVGHVDAEYTATYNASKYPDGTVNSCSIAHGLFLTNDGGKLTIVDSSADQTGTVNVNGMASGVYAASPDSVITVEGGTWTNAPCKTEGCGGTNLFLYASHGGELYIQDGTFAQYPSEGKSYLIVEHGGEFKNAVIDYSLTKVEITGGTFIGMNPEKAWFCDQGNDQAWSETNVVATGYLAISAGENSWTVVPISVTVTFNSNGGSAIDAQEIVIGANATEPDAPEKDGYTFDGWYIDEDCTNAFDFDTEITADTTLYAKWVEDAETDPEPDVDIDLGLIFDVIGIITTREDSHVMMPEKDNTFADALALYAQHRTEKESMFTDIAPTDWFYDSVVALVNKGVVNGYPDGTYRPYGNVTWGEALKLVMKAVGYGDIAPTGEHWASGYMDMAIEKGLIPGAVELDASITRGEMADLTAKAMKLGEATVASPFADEAPASAIALYEAGIINGSLDNGQLLYREASAITRAEMAAIIWRVYCSR